MRQHRQPTIQGIQIFGTTRTSPSPCQRVSRFLTRQAARCPHSKKRRWPTQPQRAEPCWEGQRIPSELQWYPRSVDFRWKQKCHWQQPFAHQLILHEKLGGPKASVILSNVQNNMSVVMTCLKLCDWLGFAATFRTKMAGYPIPELARSEDSRWCVHDLNKMHHLRKGSEKNITGKLKGGRFEVEWFVLCTGSRLWHTKLAASLYDTAFN